MSRTLDNKVSEDLGELESLEKTGKDYYGNSFRDLLKNHPLSLCIQWGCLATGISIGSKFFYEMINSYHGSSYSVSAEEVGIGLLASTIGFGITYYMADDYSFDDND